MPLILIGGDEWKKKSFEWHISVVYTNRHDLKNPSDVND